MAPERDGTHSTWETAAQLLEHHFSEHFEFLTGWSLKNLILSFNTIAAMQVLLNAKVLSFDHNLAVN